MDIKKTLIYYKSKGILPGKYPVYIKVLKTDVGLKKKYYISCLEDDLLFCSMGFMGRRKICNDLKINYALVDHFTYAPFKKTMKKVTIYLTDNRYIELGFPCNKFEYKDNELNALQLMKLLKSKQINEKNIKKGK